jgi:HSP20 family protein
VEAGVHGSASELLEWRIAVRLHIGPGVSWAGQAVGVNKSKEAAMAVLTRWHPFAELRDEMRRFQRQMDNLFGRWGTRMPIRMVSAVTYPPINLWEDAEFFYAEAELPGLKLQDLVITVTGENQLTLKGKRMSQAPENAEWHRQERNFGEFERVLSLPAGVDSSKVEARLENGVLTIKMAKKESAKPRKITVKAE